MPKEFVGTYFRDRGWPNEPRDAGSILTGVKGRRGSSDREEEKEHVCTYNIPAMIPLRPTLPAPTAAASPVSLIHGLRGNGDKPGHVNANDRCCCCFVASILVLGAKKVSETLSVVSSPHLVATCPPTPLDTAELRLPLIPTPIDTHVCV